MEAGFGGRCLFHELPSIWYHDHCLCRDLGYAARQVVRMELFHDLTHNRVVRNRLELVLKKVLITRK